MRIHKIVPVSKVNGPGSRFVVWMQGCARNCPCCFNMETHSMEKGYNAAIDDIVSCVPLNEVSGITVSGGEPFEQAEELSHLLNAAKKIGLHRLVYTGFTYEELVAMKNDHIILSLSLIDILIDGAYEKDNPAVLKWTGSGNQRVIELCNGKVQEQQKYKTNTEVYSRDGEIIIDAKGNAVATGFFDSAFMQ